MELIAKILFCGDGKVGKTSLRKNYMGEKFSSKYMITIGADLSIKEIKIKVNSTDYNLKFFLWDLAGQPAFNIVRPRYYQGGSAALLVYDISNRNSFDNIQNWINELITHNREFPIPLVLIANKSDLKDKINNPVSTSDGQSLAKNYSEQFDQEVFFLETSALTGENVRLIFENLGKVIINKSSQ